MGSAVLFTAQHMQEIRDGLITAIEIDEYGYLIASRYDNSTFSVGYVKGPPGEDGNDGADGAPGVDGAPGLSLLVVGAAVFWPGTSDPPDILIPFDGRTIVNGVNTHSALAAVHPEWVSGDDILIPNYGGHTMVSHLPGDSMFGAKGAKVGSKEHTLTVAQMPSHNHKPHQWGVVVSSGSNTGYFGSGSGGTFLDTFGQDNDQTRRTENAGGGQAHPIVQPSAVGVWCVVAASTIGEYDPNRLDLTVAGHIASPESATRAALDIAFASFDEDGDVVDAGGNKVMTVTAANTAYLAQDAAGPALVPLFGFTEHAIALSSHVAAPFDILGIGDSLFSGQAQSGIGYRWPDRAVQRLRARLGQARGGVGYVPTLWTHSSPPNPWVATGNHANQTSRGLGRQGKSLGSDQGAGVGTLTATFECSSIDLFFYIPGTESATVTIDGGSPATVSGAGASPHFLKKWSSGALTPGSHTIVVARASGTVVVLGAMVYNGDESNGIRYWDGAQSGTRVDQFNAVDGGSALWADNIGFTVTPDLIIADWMTNDYTSRTPAQFKTALGNTLALIRTKTAAPIIWVAPWERNATGQGAWAEYVEALHEVAETDSGSMVFDVGQKVPKLAGNPHGALADGTHPTDKFAAWLGDQLADFILTTWANA